MPPIQGLFVFRLMSQGGSLTPSHFPPIWKIGGVYFGMITCRLSTPLIIGILYLFYRVTDTILKFMVFVTPSAMSNVMLFLLLYL